jgi:hypothetical protein
MSISYVPLASAVSPASIPPNSSSGLSINPRKNLIANPGQTINDELLVGNLDQYSSLAINVRVVDFTYYDNSGTPKLLLAPNAPRTAWSIKPFITIPSHEIIGPSSTTTIPYTIKIPANQGAGSYYSAIEYSASGANGGNIALNASGVTLMFVTVSGKVHENLSLIKMGAYQPGKAAGTGTYTFIATQKPSELGYTLKNSGNVAESPGGTISLNYMFGGKPILISNINVNSDLVILQQTRLFTTCINTIKVSTLVAGTPTPTNVCGPDNLKPGHYSATLTGYYGQNGNPTQEINGTASFWYLPVWFIITFGGVVLFLLIIGWWIYRKIKRMLYGSKNKNKRNRY